MHPWIPIIALTAGVFSLDFILPSSYVPWVLFLLPLWLSSRMPDRRTPIRLAALYSVLIVLGSSLLVERTIDPACLFNRSAGLVVIWTTAVLLLKKKREEEEEEEQKALRIFAAHQTAVAELGLRAITVPDPLFIMQEAVAVLAKTLDVEYAKVMELQPDGRSLLLKAGVGWQEGCVGRATVGVGLDSQAGFTLIAAAPVIVEDIRTERRFSGSSLLRTHGVVSGMSVAIQGQSRLFGVLSAHTARRRDFSKRDTDFLQAVANILAATIDRLRLEDYSRATLKTAMDGFVTVDTQGNILDANEAASSMLGYSRDELIAMTVAQIEAKESPDDIRAHIQKAMAQRGDHFETRHRRKDGSIIDVEVSARYTNLDGGRFFTFFRDITGRKRNEAERERLHQKLRAAHDQLRILSHRLFEIQEEERRHLARELHDHVGQTLTAVEVNLQVSLLTADRNTRVARLEDCERLIGELGRQVRTLALGLRPSLLDDLGLIPALRAHLEQVAGRSGLQIDLAADPAAQTLPKTVQVTCFRVAQEAVTNVMRHARARRVRVNVRQHDGRLALTVQDDGIGFDLENAWARTAQGHCMGLLSMQERFRLRGGELVISSQPGLGTEVRASLPLAGDAL